MARPLATSATIPLLEEALHLVRRTPLATFALHWVGGAPFAIALLWLWDRAAQGQVSDSAWAADALLLSVLLAWMNTWRAAFAGQLRRTLSGGEDQPWTWPRIFRLAASQAFLGATKPFVLLGSALMVFPFAATVSFYRNAAAIAGSEDLAPSAAIRKARRLARIHPGQAWTLLPVLLFLQCIVAVNLALLLATLPQLVRMLTGYESSFSRSGAYFADNSLFLWLVLALTWLALDPFVQCVHCIRCFQAESLETGEDVRAGLKLLRKAAQTAAALLPFAVALAARAAWGGVSSSDLGAAVRRAMQAPEYSWRIPAENNSGPAPWIVTFTDRILAWSRSALDWIGDAIEAVIRWLLRQIMSTPKPGEGAAPAGALHRSLYILIVLVAAASAWMAWRRARARRAAGRPAEPPMPIARLEDEDLSAAQLPEARWIELGEQCLAREDFRLALRAFFLALLAWLGQSEWLRIEPGKTNREYELELRRKARSMAEARELFAQNVAAFERAWYGMHSVSRDAVEEFRARSGGIKEGMAPSQGVAA